MRNLARLLPVLFLCLFRSETQAEVETRFSGAGWVSMGRVMNANAKEGDVNDYNGNFLGASGGIVNATSTIDGNWQGSMGLGSVLVHLARGARGEANIWYPFWVGFLSEARLTFTQTGFADAGGLQFNLGSFGYNYNPDVKNLGLYLLRGYVYPGALVSGFGNLTGAMVRYKAGILQNDLIVNMETEDKPLYDLSVADVVSLKLHPGFEIGAGVNFYRILPSNEKATSPGRDCKETELGPYANTGVENACFHIRKDSAGAVIDTITGSLSGIKVMGRMRIDPKAWFGSPASFGSNEMVVYAEAGIIGLKDYPDLYDNILRRIPVMVGFNVPTFKLFDLSVEVEYYASKNSSDNIGAQYGSWQPAFEALSDVSTSRDDWKWSVNAARMLGSNLQLSGVVANDHLRLGGSHNTATGVETLRTPKDWYLSTKLAYFF